MFSESQFDANLFLNTFCNLSIITGDKFDIPLWRLSTNQISFLHIRTGERQVNFSCCDPTAEPNTLLFNKWQRVVNRVSPVLMSVSYIDFHCVLWHALILHILKKHYFSQIRCSKRSPWRLWQPECEQNINVYLFFLSNNDATIQQAIRCLNAYFMENTEHLWFLTCSVTFLCA